MHRGFPYPAVRAATNVALRALGHVARHPGDGPGTPVIYMDYTDYDEIAHHSGPERPESLDALDGVDRELATLRKAAEDAPRPYRFVILADHGQSLGETFLQRYKVTLQDVVRSLMGGKASVAAATAQIEDWGQLNTFLGEVSQTKGVTGSLARTVTRNKRADGHVDMGPDAAQFTARGRPCQPGAKGRPERARKSTDGEAKAEAEPADLIVVAGGNLALIYFNASKQRMTLEAVERNLYPDLTQALANHPGVGVLMVRTADRGTVAVGKKDIDFLGDDRVEGEDPLALYGELAPAALRRLDEIEHVGDIAVVSLYDPESGEIAAFEELIGAHGGRAERRPGRSCSTRRTGSWILRRSSGAHGVSAAAPMDGGGASRSGWTSPRPTSHPCSSPRRARQRRQHSCPRTRRDRGDRGDRGGAAHDRGSLTATSRRAPGDFSGDGRETALYPAMTRVPVAPAKAPRRVCSSRGTVECPGHRRTMHPRPARSGRPVAIDGEHAPPPAGPG